MRVLVTGATGYIGGRLVPQLLSRGHHVRVLVRDAERIRGRDWAEHVEVAVADLLDPSALRPAMAGMEAAYYLVHSMVAGRGFAQRDRLAAEHFAAAGEGQLQHVIYLGGLEPIGVALSGHLRSRVEVGQILRHRLATTEFRAGPIIGSGSASFEMVRYLTERLPAMVVPRSISNVVQPIGIRSVVTYLTAALERPPAGVVDIGADRLTFRQMMLVYASVRGLRRLIVPVPILAPRLVARWVGLVTPIPNRLAIPLVEGVMHCVVAQTDKAERLFPEIRPMSYRRAVQLALQRIEEATVQTRWSGALGQAATYQLTDREGLIRDERTRWVAAPPRQVFASFSTLGGDQGWLVWNWVWRVRGLIDRLIGGPGLRRGRRDAQELLAGEAVDFWRVERSEPDRMLLLRAEMRVPGRAWLRWEVHGEDQGTRLAQTAFFAPHGLAGAAYWYLLYPIHRIIFADLVTAIAKRAEAESTTVSTGR